MKKYLTVLVSLFSASAIDAADVYDASTATLTIPGVVVEGIQYDNVVLKLHSFDVVSVGASAPVISEVAETCASENFTMDIYNSIAIGMTFSEVNQLIGCKNWPALTRRSPDFTLYGWSWTDIENATNLLIQIYFDANGTIVTPPGGGSLFKTASGF